MQPHNTHIHSKHTHTAPYTYTRTPRRYELMHTKTSTHTPEIPAGKRDGDEKPLDCGIRELKEEIGAVANEYTYLGELLPSPGYCGQIARHML